ncbi:MAG: restriction endonuclease subunit S [Acidimicrobiaceae bacterium]|nr:restriction endonuclease subunit S [Acidimicrobiaceae bacterium]
MKRRYAEYRNSDADWIGDIPTHWDTPTFRHVCRLEYGDSLPLEVREPGGVPVYGSNGVVGEHCEANTSAPAIVVGRKGSHGKVNFAEVQAFAIDTTYFVDERSTDSNLRWLYYALSSAGLDETSKDSAVPGLSRDDAYATRLPCPSSDEQVRIAKYLDHETARIGKLITMQESLIERLDEYRTALVTRVVTKGLPPEAAEAAGLDPAPTLKDSGVEWLGEVPEHWEAGQLRRIFRIANGGTPATSDEDNWDGEIVWLTPDDLGRNDGKGISGGRRNITPEGLRSSGARLAPSSSVVLSTRAPIGHLAVTDLPAATNQGCRTLVPMTETVSGFAYYSLIASRVVLQAAGKGSTFMELSAADLAQHRLPQPPPDEQQAISDYLDTQSQSIDTLRAKAELSIERLSEYRSALISAAVTGKIDVREAT